MLSHAKKLGLIFVVSLFFILMAVMLGGLVVSNATSLTFAGPANFFNENRMLFATIRLIVFITIWANWEKIASIIYRANSEVMEESKRVLIEMRTRLLLCFVAIEIFVVQGLFGYLIGWVM